MAFPQVETTIVRYDDSLCAIEQGFVRAFLILGTERALLLDTGAVPCGLPALVRSVTDLPLTVVNTHGDGDHVANNGQFPEIWAHPEEFELIRRSAPASVLRPAPEGTVFALGGRDLEVLAAPGHTAGSIALLDRKNRMLFSGDTVQRDSVYLFGAHRPVDRFAGTLEKLDALRGAYDTVWPCHGPCPVGPETAADLLRCFRAAQAGELPPQAPSQPMWGEVQPVLYALDGCSVLLDP